MAVSLAVERRPPLPPVGVTICHSIGIWIFASLFQITSISFRFLFFPVRDTRNLYPDLDNSNACVVLPWVREKHLYPERSNKRITQSRCMQQSPFIPTSTPQKPTIRAVGVKLAQWVPLVQVTWNIGNWNKPRFPRVPNIERQMAVDQHYECILTTLSVSKKSPRNNRKRLPRPCVRLSK